MLKSIARRFVFPIVNGSGLDRLIARAFNNSHLVIMYHGVVRSLDLSLSVNHLSLDDFERQISYLAKHFDIIPLQEAVSHKRDGLRTRRKSISITFDDGYENNYTNAFPVLKKFQAPATVFVVADVMREPDYVMWYDQLDLAGDSIKFPLFFEGENSIQEKQAMLKSSRNLSEIKGILKTMTAAEKDLALKEILNSSAVERIKGVNPEYRKMLSREQIREMAESGLIEIGSHSLTHPNLDTLDDTELKKEIYESKQILEAIIGCEVISIAYPDGAYNSSVNQCALDAGYKNLIAVNYRHPGEDSNKNLIQRYCISNTTTNESNLIQINYSFRNLGF